jgi:hypothetical protein
MKIFMIKGSIRPPSEAKSLLVREARNYSLEGDLRSLMISFI